MITNYCIGQVTVWIVRQGLLHYLQQHMTVHQQTYNTSTNASSEDHSSQQSLAGCLLGITMQYAVNLQCRVVVAEGNHLECAIKSVLIVMSILVIHDVLQHLQCMHVLITF